MQASVGGSVGTKKNTLPSFMQSPSKSTVKKVDSYITKSSKTLVGKTVIPVKSKSSSSPSSAYSKMKAIENASKGGTKKSSAHKSHTVTHKKSSVASKPHIVTHKKSSVTHKVSQKHASTKVNKTTVPKESSTLAQKKKAYISSLRGGSDAYYKDQVAGLGKARDNAILQQKQVYQNAVNDGNISIGDANKQFSKDKKAIDQAFYQQGQATNITAYDNGIQNSMQMLGLQAGDNARQQQSVDTATSTRDTQINVIKNRLASLKSTTDLNVAGIVGDYGYNVSQAKAQSDKMYNDGITSFNANDYSATQGQLFNQQNATQQHNWDVQDANTAYKRQSALSNSRSTGSVKTTPKTTPKAVKPIASAYKDYKSSQATTGLDQYYKKQTSLNKRSIVQKNPALPPVSLANNQALSPWQKYRIIMGG